ncbi:MAG: DUF6541 family protein [Schaalia hyovaginalis]|uniref:DUF6541 family protein n=1 Tax=Schaalia hyovaginalis TaxID=29316 RepID=UPI002A91FFA9|nr:DUF6541 family protein [Schaalia hyovaginalis]MDY6213826.1 DUF6541 family protein [Schaalia hyovaginalis]
MEAFLSWGALYVAAVLLSAVLVLPGALAARSWGASPTVALGAGPILTLGFIGVSGVVFDLLGVGWTPATVASAAAPVLVASMALARWCAPRSARLLPFAAAPGEPRLGNRVWAACGVLIASLFALVFFTDALGNPWAILQNHDAMLHLNLIEGIHRSANASIITSSRDVSGSPLYPNGFHAWASLLVPWTSTPFAANAALLAVVGVLAPLGVSLLIASLGGGAAALIAGPLLVWATMWFPSMPFLFFAQFAATFAIVLVPGAIAVLQRLLDEGRHGTMLLLIAVMTGALCVGHPGAGQFFLIASCLIVLVPVVRRAAAVAEGVRGVLLGAGAAFACLLPLLLMPFVPRLQALARYSTSWLDPLELVEEILLYPPPVDGAAFSYAPFVLAGLFGVALAAFTRRGALVGAWGALIAVLVVGDAPEGWWWAFAGGFWRDSGRYLEVLILVYAASSAFAIEWIALRLFDRLAPSGGRARSFVATLFVAAFAVVSVWGASTYSSIWARRGFLPGWIIHPLWISPDERAGLLASASDLGADDVVYGAPQTGAGLISLYTSASAYHKIASAPSASSDEGYLAQHFSQIRSDPQVCRIIRDEGGNALLYTDSDVWRDDVEYSGIRRSRSFFGFHEDRELRHGGGVAHRAVPVRECGTRCSQIVELLL